jgi:hypothetical protein
LARKVATQNGHERLEEAMAMLIQNHAAFLGRILETDRVGSERFARIETDMAQIIRVLAEHGRILAEHSRLLADHGRLLERLPGAVRD